MNKDEFDLKEPDGFVLERVDHRTMIPILTHNSYVIGFIALGLASENPYIRIVESPDMNSTLSNSVKKKLKDAGMGDLCGWDQHRVFGVVDCILPLETRGKMKIEDAPDA